MPGISTPEVLPLPGFGRSVVPAHCMVAVASIAAEAVSVVALDSAVAEACQPMFVACGVAGVEVAVCVEAGVVACAAASAAVV